MAKSMNFKFHGTVSSYVGVLLLSVIMLLFTIGLAYPWVLTMQQRWKTSNTSVNGRRLKFTGTGFQLIGNWIVWSILTLLTLGIYSLWVIPKLQQWIVEHTDFE